MKYSKLAEWQQYRDSVRWRLTDKGVEIEDDGIPRTRGTPATVQKIWNTHKAAIEAAAIKYDLPLELIVATIATESGGNVMALRKEPGYKSDEKTPHRISPGIMQTLISTARSALNDPKLTRADLFKASTSIMAGSAYMSQQEDVTGYDAPKVACAYNAGSVYYQKGKNNRWKMRQFPIGTSAHADRFVEWFNDMMAVMAMDGYTGKAPSFYVDLKGDAAPVDRKEVVEDLVKKEVVVVTAAKKTSKLAWVQGIFAAIFGAPVATATLLDTVSATTDKTKGIFMKMFGIQDGTVLAIAMLVVGGVAAYIVLKQKGIIAERVEDEVSGKTDSTVYAGNGKGVSIT